MPERVTVSIGETESGLEAVVEGGTQPLLFGLRSGGGRPGPESQSRGWWATNGDCTLFSAPYGSSSVVGVDEPVAASEAKSGLRLRRIRRGNRSSFRVGATASRPSMHGVRCITRSRFGLAGPAGRVGMAPGVYVIRTTGPQGALPSG